MKARILAVALTAALVSPAFAQSSVTVFGIADVAVRQVNNQGRGSVTSMLSGSNSTSRVGFRGVEDLGGGLSAGFHLEHGLLIDTGTDASSTQWFDRRSTVSLSSTAWGELRAGRDYTPTYTLWTRNDPFSYVGVAGSNNFVNATPVGPIRSAFGSNLNTTVRSSNALEYLLPGNLGGLEGGLMLAAGEGGLVANGVAKVTSVRLGYSAGPFSVGVATATTANSLTAGDKFKDDVLAGSYDAGVARISLAVRSFKQAASKQRNSMLSVVVPVGVGEVKFSWNSANLSGKVGTATIDANDATQLGLGYVHNLSKRTALFASYARINNKGGATFVVPGGPAGLTGGSNSTGYELGMRHTF
ncbi:MAG: porin [Burkholderiales bacterium PBB5]|nr:MAG: porin [Burkholderiales bacterium PBB5]